MKLNGGIIGKDNEPAIGSASGVWGIEESSMYRERNIFPHTNKGWTLSNILAQPKFLSNAEILVEATPTGVRLKPDGTSLYVIGSGSDNVYQYSLSTAWDLSTIGNTVLSYNVAPQEITPQGLYFKPDGAAMYVIGTTGDDVNEYSLSESWNVASASYVKVFSISAQDTAPNDLTFKPDGTRMYILGSTGDDVNEYSLSESWNISSASYTANYSVASNDTIPTGISFSQDGTVMFVCGSVSDNVYQYHLSNAWSVDSANYVGYLDLSLYDTAPQGIDFSPSGDRMYMIGSTNDEVFEFYLPKSWNIVYPGYTGKEISTTSLMASPGGLTFKNDGTIMYVVGSSGATDNVRQYALSTAWDVSSASYDSKQLVYYSLGVFEGARSLVFNEDGTKLYLTGSYSSGSSSVNSVRQYSLSTPWDISTSAFVASGPTLGSTTISYQGLYIRNNGIDIFISTNQGTIRHEKMSTPWDISTSKLVDTFGIPVHTNSTGLYFDPSGKTLFSVSSTQDSVIQCRLSNAWDLSSISTTGGEFNLELIGERTPTDITFSQDGTKFYICGTSLNKVIQFDVE